jgi:hypothetical protein
MTHKHPSQRLGRRTDHVFLDQSPFAWTHRILAYLSGGTFAMAMIANRHLPFYSGRGQRGFALFSVVLFFVGASPFLFSYFENRARAPDGAPRLKLFCLLLSATSVAIDCAVVYLLGEGESGWEAVAVYSAQAAGYVALGALIFPHPKADVC